MKQAINNAKNLLQKYDFIKIGKNKKTILFLFFCLILGMILGTLSVSSLNMDYISKIDLLFINDFKERMAESNIQIFTSSFSVLSIFAVALELSALSCWGMALIPAIVAFKGLSLGLTAGYLYLVYGLKGIAFYLLILLPGIFISCVGITLFAAGCMKFSFNLSKLLLAKYQQESILDSLKNHLRKSGYCLIVLAMSSIIDVCFMIMFSRFFSF